MNSSAVAVVQGMAPDDVLSAEFIPTPAAAGGGGGSMLVTGAKTGAILLWSLTNGLECRAQIPAHAPTRPLPGCLGLPSNGVRALCLRDDQTLLSGGSDGKIIPWSVMQLTGNNPAKVRCSTLLRRPQRFGSSRLAWLWLTKVKPNFPLS